MATHRRLLSEMETAVRAQLDEAVAAFWTQANLYTVLTRAAHAVATEVRKLKADYYLTSRTSLDGNVTIYGVSYDTASFRIVSGVSVYTLPQDLLELHSIECVTSGYEDIEFNLGKSLAHPDFKAARLLSLNGSSGGGVSPTGFYADVVGESGLVIAPTSDTTLDLRIWYIANTPIVSTAGASLKDFATGTDELVLPHPGYMAVEEVAIMRAQIKDRDATASVYARLADATVARLFGADARQTQDPIYVRGMWE